MFCGWNKSVFCLDRIHRAINHGSCHVKLFSVEKIDQETINDWCWELVNGKLLYAGKSFTRV